MHGLSWSFTPTIYQATLDNETPVTLFSGSALPRDPAAARFYVQGLIFFRANLSNSTHVLTVDNKDGAGQMGLDYLEVMSVTGGIP